MRFNKKLLAGVFMLGACSVAVADGEPDGFISDAPAKSFVSAPTSYPAGNVTEFLSGDNQTVVLPGKLTTVPISQEDVNLIHCEAGYITDSTTSEEKPITIQNNVSDSSMAFAKLLQRQNENTLEWEYYTKEVDAHITCNGEMYRLMLNPQNIPSQKIILSAGKGNVIKTNIEMFKELDIEDSALTLIDMVMFDQEMPATFTVSAANINETWKTVMPTVRARHIKSVKPEGVGLVVHEYVVYSDSSIPLNEFDFVSLRDNTFAVRLAKATLQAKESTKVYIVERMWR